MTSVAEQTRQNKESALVKEQIALIEQAGRTKPLVTKYMVANMFAVSIGAVNHELVPELLPEDDADDREFQQLWAATVTKKLVPFCTEDGTLSRERLSYILAQIYDHFVPGLMYEIRKPRMMAAMKRGY